VGLGLWLALGMVPCHSAELGGFVQRAFVKSMDTAAGDAFGHAVALSGETLIVGVPAADWDHAAQPAAPEQDAGAAYVYARSGNRWVNQATLRAPLPAIGAGFGCSVAISGQMAVVGAWGEDGAGSAHVFSRAASGEWSHIDVLKAADPVDGGGFGWCVAITGDTIVVGAYAATSSGVAGAGAAYVFVRSGNAWEQLARLEASNAGAGDAFGWAVSISGDAIAVGAPFEDGSAGIGADNSLEAAGAVYVFRRNGVTWAEEARVKASNVGSADGFGYAVSLIGDTLAIGAPFESGGGPGAEGTPVGDDTVPSAGAGYTFARVGDQWLQQAYVKASNPDSNDRFGYAVSLQRDLLAVGAVGESSVGIGVNSGAQSNNAAPDSGAVYQFKREPMAWSQQGYIKSAHSASGHQMGVSVAALGDVIAVGAAFESSDGRGVDPASPSADAPASGAAYVFSGTALTPLESWQLAYFGDTPSVAGVDSDLDGTQDLLEFAYGTDPTSASTGTNELAMDGSILAERGRPIINATKLSASSLNFKALFCRRADWEDAGLTYTVQFSGDLTSWVSSSAAPVVVASDGLIDACAVRYPFFVNGLKARFFRVVVNLGP